MINAGPSIFVRQSVHVRLAPRNGGRGSCYPWHPTRSSDHSAHEEKRDNLRRSSEDVNVEKMSASLRSQSCSCARGWATQGRDRSLLACCEEGRADSVTEAIQGVFVIIPSLPGISFPLDRRYWGVVLVRFSYDNQWSRSQIGSHQFSRQTPKYTIAGALTLAFCMAISRH